MIRVRESSCPFCGASQRHTKAPLARLSLGLTLGLGVVGMYGCNGDEDLDMTTVADSQDDADAVTYAGPDDPTSSMSDGWVDMGSSTTGDTTFGDNNNDADASTYAGPDEGDSIGSSGTFGPAGSESGSDSGSDSGTHGSTTEDWQEADASTYAGPDENATTTGG